MPIRKAQFSAVMFRRWTLMKRSWKSWLLSALATLIFSALGIVMQYTMKLTAKPDTEMRTFRRFSGEPSGILLVNDGTWDKAPELNQILVDIFEKDTGRTVTNKTFGSAEELNDFLWVHQSKWGEPYPMAAGFGLNADKDGITMQFHYNTSTFKEVSDELTAELMGTRALWKYMFGSNVDFRVAFSALRGRQMDLTFGRAAPIIMVTGLISIIPLIINQPIIDMTGEVRSYMQSCTLKVFPYWCATFIIDFCLWLVEITVIWAMMLAAQTQAFLDNMLACWYLVAMAGPSFILFCYCFSFIFDAIGSATRISFMVFIVMLLVPFVVLAARGYAENPLWLQFIYSLFPHLCINGLYNEVLTRSGPFKQPFSYFWTEDKASLIFFIMEFVDIPLYMLVLYLIEHFRGGLESRKAKKAFGNYNEFFEKAKAEHEYSPEAAEMEEQVRNSHDFAVRIDNVSRLFFNSEGKPIPAVNSVSLGVKKGSLFGFLGANGAGKTTLIRMITSLLPISNGTIEVNGRDITEFHDPTAISICPQFNRHLCYEMTVREHFTLYGLLFEMPKEQQEERSSRLIKELELEPIADKQIKDLSQGDVRKLAIALSFYGPAEIILLDEPTASLDPVARHNVQEMITLHKGTKTFMLCTHLLSEAEALCDIISIMVKGCVYTVGTPQMLTEKFGKDFKIDLMLKDETDACATKCDRFFRDKLPQATLSIQRPKARIYDMPSNAMELCDLFEVMDAGLEGDNGYTYFTCSSSSLERVFMEIVKMSEQE